METNNTPIAGQMPEKKPEAIAEAELFETFEEDSPLQFEKQSSDQDIANLIEKHRIEYPSKMPSGERYSPYKHSGFYQSQEQQEFFVYYAFPNGAKSPVASFWTTQINERGDDRFKFVHIDLAKVLDLIIQYYRKRGHLPPPRREFAKQGKS